MKNSPNAVIHRPSLDLFSSFEEFVEEMRAEGETLWAPYLPQADERPKDFIERQLRRETDPVAPMVPETVFWGVISDQVVGRISLRHFLAGSLTKMGGHVGYEVRPSYRRRGIATEMLRLVLATDRAKEIGQLLLTCSPQNQASNKTIVANHGVLTGTVFVDFIGEDRHHYWIDLNKESGGRKV